MKQTMALLLLVVLTFISSVELIKTRHSIRYALKELDRFSDETMELEIENHKLLLEYAHLASGYRVEDLAESRLNMYNPDLSEIVVVR